MNDTRMVATIPNLTRTLEKNSAKMAEMVIVDQENSKKIAEVSNTIDTLTETSAMRMAAMESKIQDLNRQVNRPVDYY
jgi:methyl-accepting chemotaxis protein